MYGPDLSLGASPQVKHQYLDCEQGIHRRHKSTSQTGLQSCSTSRWRMQFGMQSISSHPKSFSPNSFSCYRGKPTDHWQLDKTNTKTYIEYFLVGFWWCSLSQLFNSNRNFNLLPFWDPKSLPKRSTKSYSVSHLRVNSPNYLYILHLLSRLKYSEQWEHMADNKNMQKTSCGC